MAQVRLFEGPDIGTSVILAGRNEYLEVGEHGVLTIPQGLKPNGFHLVLMIPEEAPIVITQKNVGQEGGGYHHHALDQMKLEGGIKTWVMHDPVVVRREGGDVWTEWHKSKPNRIDCWFVGEHGAVDLFQVGVMTPDNGRTFRLLGDYRWRGKVMSCRGNLVAKPADLKWGPVLWNEGESRADIRNDANFRQLLENAVLEEWSSSNDELYPPLGPWDDVRWRMDWYIPFAGQGGQGIAKNRLGQSAWVLRQDVQAEPDEDGIVRFWHNDPLICSGPPEQWGTKKGAPPKLPGVRRT